MTSIHIKSLRWHLPELGGRIPEIGEIINDEMQLVSVEGGWLTFDYPYQDEDEDFPQTCPRCGTRFYPDDGCPCEWDYLLDEYDPAGCDWRW
jgi:hypothetical protein